MASARISQLAEQISHNSKIITDFLASKNLTASLDEDSLEGLPITPLDKEAYAARSKLIAATQELRYVAVGPREHVTHLAWDSITSLSLQAIEKFKVAQAVPLEGDISYAALAELVQLDLVNLRRLIRHAITNHIFREPRPGYVAHTGSSRLLAQDEQMQSWVGFLSEDCWRPVAYTVEALEKWQSSQEPNHTGFQLANQTNEGFFDVFAKRPVSLNRYGKAMAGVSASEGYSLRHVVDGYPWAELGEATIVDLGGSQGHLSVAIAKAHPSLKFVVQELPSMRPPHVTATVDPEVASRVSLTTHSFLEPQPVQADVYMFRNIFHNWPDAYALKILRALVPALRPGAKVLLNDGVLPEPGSITNWEDKSVRTIDVLQLSLVNGRERELDEWKALFPQADPRLKFSRAWKPEDSHFWLIEGIYV